MDRPQRARRPQKDDVLQVPVHALAFGGKGVARLDEFVIFVAGGVPGDVARVLVTRSKKRYAEARVLDLVEPSPSRVRPRCSSFGTCGGCVWQSLDYDKQLTFKSEQVRDCLERLGGLKDFELRPILGMVDPWRYRNRVDFSIGDSPDGAVVGFRPPGRWDTVLPVAECHLLPEQMESIRASVECWLRKEDLPGWDPRAGEGFARQLVVRSAQRGAELLACLVTAPAPLPDADGLVQTLRSVQPGIVGVVQSVNSGRAELSAGLESRTLWGRPHLLETLTGVTLKVSLDAFFQTNAVMAQTLFDLVAEEAYGPSAIRPAPASEDGSSPPGPIVWDLYSGVGSIALSLSDRAAAVLGVEAVPGAVSDAEANALLNGIENTCFVAGDVRRVLREVIEGPRVLPDKVRKPDVVVVDPPRAGLSKKVVSRIAEVRPPRIVYVSCNPSTMAPNVAQFDEQGYRLERVTPVDMFPHTPHVEAVALLVRRGDRSAAESPPRLENGA
jgi:23S rRNA (uracil1939-C5)-methyltransferase